MNQLRVFTLAILGLIGALAACSPAASAAPTQGAVATQPPVVPSVRPTPPWEPCVLGNGEGCLEDAGDYRSPAFAGGVAYSLPTEGWQNYSSESDLIALFATDDAFGGEMWLEIIRGPVKVGPGLATPAEEVGDLTGALDAFDNLTITSVTGREVGGLAAQIYDVEATEGDTVELFGYAETDGQYFQSPGITVRICWLETADGPILVTVEAPTSDFAAFMDAIGTPFLDSIAFGS